METTSTVPVVVESGGDQVVGHVGLHALGDFADRLGLGEHLSARIPFTGERAPLHDRGKVLVHTSLMLAGGGESCADIEHLRAQRDLFGPVASDSTVYRTVHEITPEVREAIAAGLAEVRHEDLRWPQVASGSRRRLPSSESRKGSCQTIIDPPFGEYASSPITASERPITAPELGVSPGFRSGGGKRWQDWRRWIPGSSPESIARWREVTINS
jgi:hypothetical protein